MSHKQFIVLIRHPNDIWVPLVDENDIPLQFDSRATAKAAALTNVLIEKCGGVIVNTNACEEL